MTEDQFQTIMTRLRAIERHLAIRQRRIKRGTYKRKSQIAADAVSYLTSGASGFEGHAERKQLLAHLTSKGYARRSAYRFIALAAAGSVPGFRSFEHDRDRIAYGE